MLAFTNPGTGRSIAAIQRRWSLETVKDHLKLICQRSVGPVFDPRAQATLLAAAAASAAAQKPAPADAAPPPDGLTQREAEILGLIARGLTNPGIAAQLFLSNHTIKTHISRILAKTGSRDRVAAIGYAHRHGIS
ncbi:MAG: response regulator transcription factor [Streptosporangiaceae bacterium]